MTIASASASQPGAQSSKIGVAALASLKAVGTRSWTARVCFAAQARSETRSPSVTYTRNPCH